MQAVRSVASGGKFYRLPPDKENTEVGPLNSLLQHYSIVIATGKCLSSYREDLPKLGVKPQPKNAKRPLLDDVLLKNVFAEDRIRNY